MNLIAKMSSTAVFVTLGLALTVGAAEPPKLEAPADWDKLVGQPVDLAPLSYLWRADRQVQETSEAYFIPRRLKRLDEVYRKIPIPVPPHPAMATVKDIERFRDGPMPPAPTGQLALGLLWIGPVAAIKVELNWPGTTPPVESVEKSGDFFHPALPPCPDLRTDVIEDLNSKRFCLARNLDVEIRIIDQNKALLETVLSSP